MSESKIRPMPIDREAWARNLRADANPNMDDTALERWVNNYFAFWAICPTGACKRARRCAGNPRACHDLFWPHVPERMKFAFRSMVMAANGSVSVAEVKQKMKEDLARFDALVAEGVTSSHSSLPARESAARSDAAGPAAEGPPPRERPPGQRVRML